jgi:hypothetical protein
MMNCPYCKVEVIDNHCPKCGVKVTKGEPSTSKYKGEVMIDYDEFQSIQTSDYQQTIDALRSELEQVKVENERLRKANIKIIEKANFYIEGYEKNKGVMVAFAYKQVATQMKRIATQALNGESEE